MIEQTKNVFRPKTPLVKETLIKISLFSLYIIGPPTDHAAVHRHKPSSSGRGQVCSSGTRAISGDKP